MEPLTDEEIEARRQGGLSAWAHAGPALVRDHRAADFDGALALLNAVAALAQEADHHPDMLLHGYNRVRLTLSTHSAGGVTERDIALAERIEALLR